MTFNWHHTLLFGTLLLLQGCSGEPTSSDSFADPDVGVLFVAPELVDCVGLQPQQCMQVRKQGESEWSFFYDSIHGFEFEAGYYWTLEVQYSTINDPPADASSIRVELIRVVQKIMAAPGSEDIEVAATPVSCDPSLGQIMFNQSILGSSMPGQSMPGQSMLSQSTSCLRIRALGNQEWHEWAGGIQGYVHSPGISNVLRVNNISYNVNAQHKLPIPFTRELVAILASH